MRSDLKWLNPSLPQTLQTAVLIFYIRAVFGVLFGGPIGILIAAAEVGAGLGIANEKKYGYVAGIIVSGVSVLLAFGLFRVTGGAFEATLQLLFDAALLLALLHPQSREYQKIWFR